MGVSLRKGGGKGGRKGAGDNLRREFFFFFKLEVVKSSLVKLSRNCLTIKQR